MPHDVAKWWRRIQGRGLVIAWLWPTHRPYAIDDEDRRRTTVDRAFMRGHASWFESAYVL